MSSQTKEQSKEKDGGTQMSWRRLRGLQSPLRAGVERRSFSQKGQGAPGCTAAPALQGLEAPLGCSPWQLRPALHPQPASVKRALPLLFIYFL